MSLAAHLVVVPILLPLATAAAMVLVGDNHRRSNAIIGLFSCGLQLSVACVLFLGLAAGGEPGVFRVYLPGNWDVPFGIVLVADRLAAMMVLLTAALGLAAALYSAAGAFRAGAHFPPLLQVQLMGLAGVFLTADVFNLFVFFEVMLAASYGLLLHGSGRTRVRSGLAFIAVNLMASSLFLIGVAVLYGVTGTLGLADMAQRVAVIEEADRGLMQAGASILAIAFLIKAAAWPLGFWLPRAYTAASAPVAALFVIMTKVGVYALVRVWALLFPEHAGSAHFGGAVLLAAGLATIAFGSVGLLASQGMARLAAYSVIVSAGTLLAAFALAHVELTAAALVYLASSTLAGAAFFLVADLAERSREVVPLPSLDEIERDLPPTIEQLETDYPNLDDEEMALVGRAIPAAMAFLGFAFIACALLIAGLPPLSGFVAKLAMLVALLAPAAQAGADVDSGAWALAALIIGTGLAALFGMSRAGVRLFWAPQGRPPPRLRMIEGLPVAALLLACVALTWKAEPALAFARAAAAELHRPRPYIDAVMSSRPVPGPTRQREEGAR